MIKYRIVKIAKSHYEVEKGSNIGNLIGEEWVREKKILPSWMLMFVTRINLRFKTVREAEKYIKSKPKVVKEIEV
jgi:hypothetical protein